MIRPTKYYEEFLRYYEMATRQQAESNLGAIPHLEGSIQDDLMRHVELYDVAERKYAGFTQIVLDLWYGDTSDHPYAAKGLHNVRQPIAQSFTGIHAHWSLEQWLYVFIVHRVTGSGINYAKKPSGYNNTVLPDFAGCLSVDAMVGAIRNRADSGRPFYTSVGYQFPAFPKPAVGYKRGGDYFLCELAPKLAADMAAWLRAGTRSLREAGEWMFKWNKDHGLRAYKFQYAAVLSDIADFYPELIDGSSLFYYGTNARECIKYLATPVARMNEDDFLDEVTRMACRDVGGVPYNVEDVCCDFIRWIENYVKPGHDYEHVCRDSIWNSSTIHDHPFGRQRAMLQFGLVKSFNEIGVHPSDDYVLSRNNMTAADYQLLF